MNNTPTKKRTYDEQFKRDAVALLEGGRKAAQLARELGISHWNLRDWKDRYGTGACRREPARAQRRAGDRRRLQCRSRSGGDRLPAP
jgi:transposase